MTSELQKSSYEVLKRFYYVCGLEQMGWCVRGILLSSFILQNTNASLPLDEFSIFTAKGASRASGAGARWGHKCRGGERMDLKEDAQLKCRQK